MTSAPQTERADQACPWQLGAGFWTLVLGACLLIVAHGCHGPDEDHELFSRAGNVTLLLGKP